MLNQSNWQCPPIHLPADDYRMVEQVEMKDGSLRHQYWGEDRIYSAKRQLFGLRF